MGCPACREFMDETDRVNVFLRRPVLTAVAVAVLALIVVDSVRRTVERGPRTERWWPVLVLLAVAVYSVGAFVYVSTRAGRSKLAAGGDDFGVARTRSALALLRLAFATAPVVLAVGAVFLGAPTGVAWGAFTVTCLLLTAWAVRPDR